MTIGTQIKTTIARAVVCGIAVAALGAPAALADPPQGHRATSPDALDRYVANNRQQEVRSPMRVPDALDRYVTNVLPRIHDDRPDGYQPQLRGTEIAAVAVSRSSSDEFAWSDAGIGAGFGFALSLVGMGGLLLATRRRGRWAHM